MSKIKNLHELALLLLCLCGCIIERIDALLDNGVTYVPTSTAEASDGSGTDTSTDTTSTGSTSSSTTSTSTTSTADGGGGSSAGLVSTTTGEVETSGGDASETTAAPGPVCGDGVVEGAETCDDGNQTPGDGCQECAKDSVVFVTSVDFQGGKLGGLELADQNCRVLAAKAGLARPEAFKAWLSDTKTAAVDRLVHSRGRYVLVNGLVVAEDWDDLISGVLLRPIDVDEHGQTGLKLGVWTGTLPNGQIAPGSALCSDWKDMSQKQEAGRGVSSEWGMYWSFVDNSECGGELALYCIEQ